jgi:hypothetical protein
MADPTEATLVALHGRPLVDLCSTLRGELASRQARVTALTSQVEAVEKEYVRLCRELARETKELESADSALTALVASENSRTLGKALRLRSERAAEELRA